MDRLGKIGASPLVKDIPYDAEVEYLEGDGIAYITLMSVHGLTWADNLFECECKVRAAPAGNTTTINMCESSERWYGLSLNYHGNYKTLVIERYANVAAYKVRVFDGFSQPHIYYWTPSAGYIDGELYQNYSPTLSGSLIRDIYMFKNAYSGVISHAGDRVYWLRFFINNTLRFNLIPVRFTNENGQTEGAMYDKVTKQLFRNAGTGAFIIGPDISSSQLSGGGGG